MILYACVQTCVRFTAPKVHVMTILVRGLDVLVIYILDVSTGKFCLHIVAKYIVVFKLWLNGLYFLLKQRLKVMHFVSHVPLVSAIAGPHYDTNVTRDGDRTLGPCGTGSY